MRHREFIEEHRVQLGALVKAVEDTADLLDHPCMQITMLGGPRDVALHRIQLIEELSAMAIWVGLPSVPLNSIDLFATRPACDPGVRQIEHHLDDQFRCSFIVDELQALKAVLHHMPWLLNRSAPWSQPFLCALNVQLLRFGREPVRPDHREMKVQHAVNENPPLREVRALILDDTMSEIVRTWSALRGWPNVRLDAFHVDNLPNEEDEAFRGRVADEVISRSPDLVLMDQGLPLSSGAEIIGEIHRRQGPNEIVFVGNTGGDPSELNRAGAIGNAMKGHRLDPIIRGLSRIC